MRKEFCGKGARMSGEPVEGDERERRESKEGAIEDS